MVPRFRGRNIETGEWVYGHLFYFDDGRHFISPTGTDVVGGYGGAPAKYRLENLVCFEIKPETVGQSTGLKDKNGAEIFEGDVLLHTSSSVNYSDTYWHSYVQVYRIDSGAYRIKGKHIYDTELMSARNRLEVVGNIYQNQNLLDKEYFSTSDGIVEQANES